MSSIPRGYRRELSRAEFLEACEVYGLQPAWKDSPGGRLFLVFNPARAEPRRMRAPGISLVEPSLWWEHLRSVTTSDLAGVPVPALRVVQDRGQPDRLGVAFTAAGKADWDEARSFGGRDARDAARRLEALRGDGARPRRGGRGAGMAESACDAVLGGSE